MPSSKLPAHPNLQQYKKQAKELLKHYRAGDREALARFRRFHPRLDTGTRTAPPAVVLADAQLVLARELGFDSWPKLVRHLTDAAGDTRTAAAPRQIPVTGGEVNLCVFIENGRRALMAAERDPVRMWDVESRRLLRTFDAYSIHAWAVKPTRDGRSLLIGGRDGAIRVVDATTGELVKTLPGHHALVRCLDVSPDMSLAISGAGMRDHALRVWRLESGRCIQLLEGHRGGMYTVAFDADQRRALSGSRDTTVRLWDLDAGRCMAVLEGHTYHVHAVAWAADGRHALSCSRDIRLWDVQAARCVRVFEGHTETIRSVAWSPDQRRALSAAHDGTVRVWDVERGECTDVLAGHSTGVINAAWSADGRRAFSCDWNGEIRTWRLGR